MVETNRKNVKELAIGDKVLEEYMEEAKMVEENDNYLREAYDHRQAEIEVEKEEAADKKERELVQSMFKNGIAVEDIEKITKLSKEKIQQILKSK